MMNNQFMSDKNFDLSLNSEARRLIKFVSIKGIFMVRIKKNPDKLDLLDMAEGQRSLSSPQTNKLVSLSVMEHLTSLIPSQKLLRLA